MISLGVMVSFSFAVFAINALHKKEEENVQDNFKKKRARVSPSILPLVGPSVHLSVCHTWLFLHFLSLKQWLMSIGLVACFFQLCHFWRFLVVFSYRYRTDIWMDTHKIQRYEDTRTIKPTPNDRICLLLNQSAITILISWPILCFSLIINGKADRRTDRWTDRRTEYGRRDILTEVFTEENMDLHSLYTISRKLHFKTSIISRFSSGIIVWIFLYLERFLATLTWWQMRR